MDNLPAALLSSEAQRLAEPQLVLFAVYLGAVQMVDARAEGDIRAGDDPEIGEFQREWTLPGVELFLELFGAGVLGNERRRERELEEALSAMGHDAGCILPAHALGPILNHSTDLSARLIAWLRHGCFPFRL
jgi:hypothetical protein